jgi:hypothetical protein
LITRWHLAFAQLTHSSGLIRLGGGEKGAVHNAHYGACANLSHESCRFLLGCRLSSIHFSRLFHVVASLGNVLNDAVFEQVGTVWSSGFWHCSPRQGVSHSIYLFQASVFPWWFSKARLVFRVPKAFSERYLWSRHCKGCFSSGVHIRRTCSQLVDVTVKLFACVYLGRAYHLFLRVRAVTCLQRSSYLA